MLLSQLSSLSSLVFGFPLESTDTTMIFKAWTNLRIGSGQNVPADDQASPSKAEQRRAQVRKAQIQHRQRKANYVKTLETDAERYREMIATTRREALAIHAENEAIKAQLLQHSLKLSLDQNLFLTEQMASTPSPRNDDHEAYNMLPLEDITMTLGYDDIMNAPCYYISSSPSPSQFGSSVNSLEGSAAPETCSAAPNPHLPEMTPQQIQQAINFILALEHICRDHSHPSLFSSSSEFPSTDEDCITGRESGHTLMATSLALRSAPSNVFQAARKTKLFPGSSISIRPPAPDSSDAVSWQASGLTLQSLYGLACSLHGKDDAEVTPVQVWFELVARYGVDAVLGAIDQMKREFIGVVKCPHYGAVLEREAFESIVGRVLGSASG
ncbi:hypothetical protein QBC42DRAFT_262454 [Cladorrhinum samala]|uniref:BZIP domain-containing protein n=1 Tax=Cladorrhinum samala TaxID=585594 RepID=A0AAV9HVV3_9PEZI|nr:hypothetical protein QBC42DRAFT_262454 [Cladorrhinum samala]